MPGEARGAAGLGEAHRSLCVRERRRGEDDAGDEEDERRQAEREGRGDAERVVDRGADVPVDGGEESGRPEDALEAMLFTAPPRHRRNLLRYAVGMRVIGVIALGLTLCAAASAASGRPALRVTDLKPFTVQGYRFDPGEHLRIVVTTKRRVERKLDANRRGTFTTVFRRLSVPRCGQYSVRAYGPSGLLAATKSAPQSCGTPVAP